MKEFILNNNLKLIHKKTECELSSICISLDAGAGKEKEILGLAHATEHNIYKSTHKRNEDEINRDLNNIFGFQNAMTNYSYVIYYGTSLNEDLESGIELFSDILINASFTEDGFSEEMNVIKEELNEWDEELEQYCEDKLFLNVFNEKRRIKYPIIGKKESLDNINLENIKQFYNENYFPENTTIVIVSKNDSYEIKELVEKYFGIWQKRYKSREEYKNKIEYSMPETTTFNNTKKGIKNSRIEIIAPIHELSFEELRLLRVFNAYFGDGVNSVLYDALRTRRGLIYDVICNIDYDNYIKLYKINFTTQKRNVDKALKIVKDIIENLEMLKEKLSEEDVRKLCKTLTIKKLFNEEKSIIFAKELATYDTMFKDYTKYNKYYDYSKNITVNEVIEIGKKVLSNISVQIISAFAED